MSIIFIIKNKKISWVTCVFQLLYLSFCTPHCADVDLLQTPK